MEQRAKKVEAVSMQYYRFDGSCTMGAAIVPQLRPVGGQARPLYL